MVANKLTLKQQRFIDEYLIDLNATQAAIRAGYSEKTANEQGARLLVNVSIANAIQAAINARQARTELTADEVLNDLRELRDMCMGRKRITISIKKQDDDGNIYYEDEDIAKFDPQGANKSLELLGKHLGLFAEKMDVNVGVKEDVLDMLAQLEQQSRQQSQKLAEKLEQRKG